MKDWAKIEARTEEIKSIFENTESELHKIEGDNALLGLILLSKYQTKKDVLSYAEHDIIYSFSLNEVIELGVTDEDLTELARMNWHICEEFDGLACFV
jgi:hypothetical protein